jgi:PAS domain S-box-containing protein
MDIHRSMNALHRCLHGILRRPVLGITGVALAGVVGSLILFAELRTKEHERLEDDFLHAAEDRVSALKKTLEFDSCILGAIRSFYDGSESVERAEFCVFVSPMLRRHPSIRALEWVTRVAESERESLEEAAVRDGLADFWVIEDDPQGVLIPAQPRKEYFPITYVEPHQGNVARLGFDLGTLPPCRRAMDCARDSGEMAATSCIRLIGEPGAPWGLRFFLPVYRHPAPISSVAQRRVNLRGFVVGVFRVQGIVEEGISALTPGSVQFTVQDNASLPGGQFLYAHPSRTHPATRDVLDSAAGKPPGDLQYSESLNVGGRRWQIDCTPAPAFLATRRSWQSWVSLVFGLLMTMLTVGYLIFATVYYRHNERLTAKLSDTVDAIQNEIKERTGAEQAAKREAAKLSAMISGMQEGVVFADSENVIVEINDYFCSLFGRQPAEILGKRIEDFHASGVLEHIHRVLAQFRKDTDFAPLVMQRPLGKMEVVLRMQPIYREGVYDGVLLNVIDVTELVQARKQAEEATEAKSRFLAVMSHEIRTPLSAILGYTDLLRDAALPPGTRASYLAIVRRNAEHLLQLINDILDLAKIEAGKMTVELQPCHLVSLVADVASMMRPRAEQRGNLLQVLYNGNVPETIGTDGARLQQALINLVGNAAKFTEKGSIQIVVSYLPRWRNDQPAVSLEVVDTGIGIQPEILPQLFQPFVQAHQATSRRFGGTGLGLTICKQLVEMLGGELGVRSTPGKGSTFTITVPAGDLAGVRFLESPAEALSELRELDRGPPAPQSLAGIRILLAEDSIDNQELLCTFLTNAGATVEVAENGKTAVEKAYQQPFHVILMDMNMPDMDGYEATRLLRHHGYLRPILALTANAMSGDSQRCLAAGCNMHLTKPVDRLKLIQIIAEYASVFSERTDDDDALPAKVPPPATSPASSPRDPCEIRAETDQNILRSQFAEDPELTAILPRFIQRLPEKLQALEGALEYQRFEDLERLAHRLKGSAGGYGFPTLTEAALDLQEAAQAANPSEAARILLQVKEICTAICRGENDVPAEAGKI